MDEALARMDERFSVTKEADGKRYRPSLAPEKLMPAMLLQFFYGVRSELHLVEQIKYNLLLTKKGNHWHFGMNAHLVVDAQSGLLHMVVGTVANVNDINVAGALLRGEEHAAFGDAGY